MRKSNALIMAIMLVAFGAMFAAAGSALGPLAEDADSAKMVCRMLEARGDIVPGTRVRLTRRKAGEGGLAETGFGLLIRLTPSPAVKSRRGGLRAVAIRAAHEAVGRYRGSRLNWVEIIFDPDGGGRAEKPLRTLLRLEDGGLLGEPDPALPLRLPTS